MRRWTGSALVQVMACRISGAKPLPVPTLPPCQLCPWEQTLKFKSKLKKIHSWKCVWNCRLRAGGHFVQGQGPVAGQYILGNTCGLRRHRARSILVNIGPSNVSTLKQNTKSLKYILQNAVYKMWQFCSSLNVLIKAFIEHYFRSVNSEHVQGWF